MSEIKTEVPPAETPAVPATSAKRERSSTPETDTTNAAAGPTKKTKGANGEATSKSPVDVKSELATAPTTSTAAVASADGKKMDDVAAAGYVFGLTTSFSAVKADPGPSSSDANAPVSASGSSSSLAAPPSSVPAAPVQAAEPPVQQISMRSLIVTQDASIIIGRAGAHVNEIRERSGARVTVSESIPGNPERILNVSGALDAVAKAFGLIVRRINDEPFDVASVPGSRAVTIKFIIPNSRMGSVIGKGGAKIKEIQEASGARLNASEAMLPGSTERVLSVSGVADAVHIAVYYIGTILLEFNERNPGAATGLYRQQGARGGPQQPPNAPYVPNGGGGGPGMGGPSGGGMGGGGPHAGGGGGPAAMPGAQTQQIFIPNAFVGAIIGKGGAKINEIRQQSQCQIRVTDPGTPATPGSVPNPEERLVTITGMPHHINTAVSLLYSRLEQEKQKNSPIH